MAGPPELFNFVKKFLNLWHSGQNARMSVECEAGQAYVNLHLHLGPADHEKQEHQQPQKRAGPSRLRRRERRAQTRAEAAKADPHPFSNPTAEEAGESSKAADNSAPSVAEKASANPGVKEAAVKAASDATTDVAVKATTPFATHDVTEQAAPHSKFHPLPQAGQVPAHPQVQLPPSAQDVFCPDTDFLTAWRAEHENDRQERQKKRREEQERDLENFRKMLDKSLENVVENCFKS